MKLATLCYVKKDAQTLMIHRIKRPGDMHAGKWNGLGGKMEPGETPEECAVREVFEESGLRVRNPRLRGFLTFPAFANEEDWYAFVFTITDFEGELIDPAEGHLAWIADEKLSELPLWEGDHLFFPWLERDDIFSAKFVYRAGRLVEHWVTFHPMD